MAYFIGHQTNRLDKKGRVSLPSAFRTELGGDGSRDVFLLPHHRGEPVIIGFGKSYLKLLEHNMRKQSPFSQAGEAMRRAILTAIVPTLIDGNGRIILAPHFLEILQAENALCFEGIGETFQIRAGTLGKGWTADHSRHLGKYLEDMSWEPFGENR